MSCEKTRKLSAETIRAIESEIQNPERSLAMRSALRLQRLLESETVEKRSGERIFGQRTLCEFPDIYAPGEKERIHAAHFIHEQGRVCNISPDWQGVIRGGLLPRRATACEMLDAGRGDAAFLRAALVTIDAVIAYVDRYEEPALSDAVRNGASDFLTALQMFRMLHLAQWASGTYHNTVGRFDQYVFPYYERDVAAGKLTRESALDLLEEFFLSFNRDSEMYTGMQQGDNGQSMMLGGCDAQGNDTVNALTDLCIEASLHNRQIDPKINLRVNAKTPLSLYEQCTRLTKQGLGFPQYANDDVVVPGLVALGYDPEDARDYTVAACWEFIIPGVAMDIPNIAALSLPKAVDEALRASLVGCADFQALKDKVREVIFRYADEIEAQVKNLWIEPAPWQSVLMKGCLERGQDVSQGLKYNNYGVHGTGIADAVDALAAVRRYVFNEKRVAPEALLEGMRTDYASDPALKNLLRTEAPKMGRDDECLDLADFLMETFADSLEGRKNERGGIFRAGTGSAMYYVWHAKELGALANGHDAGERLPANFSPSLMVTDAGPLSVIRAFARPALRRCINGGPLTLELHDTVFRNDEGLKKVAMLVQAFIQLGGHQLQLNAVSRETLLKAQADPDAYRNLIVRVWGWSGYFVQLDKQYQDQILARNSYKNL